MGVFNKTHSIELKTNSTKNLKNVTVFFLCLKKNKLNRGKLLFAICLQISTYDTRVRNF